MKTFILCCFSLLFLTIPLSVLSFSGGSGTSGDPWQIATPADLAEMSDYLGIANTNRYYVLTTDIDLDVAPYNTGSGWDPIGYSAHNFYGQFDGAGYTISNLYINTTTNYVGLFGIAENATIENLTLANIQVTGDRYTGGLIGYATDTTSTQVIVSGTITSTDLYGGGIVGWHNSGPFISVTSTVDVTHTGTGQYTGGVVGYMGGGSMLDAAATGTVSGYLYVGGVAGMFADGVTTVSSSYASGDVIGRSDNIGGFVGQIAAVDVYNSYATGNVSSTGNALGGFFGFSQQQFSLNRVYATGDITGNNSCGGLGGYSDSNLAVITDSYARGDIDCNNNAAGILSYAGGATLNQVYYAGDLSNSGNTNKGGLVSIGTGSLTVNNSFWDTEVSGAATTASSKGTGTSTVAMKTQSTFTDASWDFDNVWAMDSEINDGYAYLAWQIDDTTAPTISSLSPADDATGVLIDSNLVVTFDEDIVTGTGYIYLKLSNDNTIIEQFDVASSTVTASGTTALVLNPTSNLAYNTAYYLTIDATAIDDTSGNSFAGIADSSIWNFVTIVAPPTSLQYTTPNTFTVATAISSLSPVVVGGTPTSFSILPALPAGLLLDPVTGVISGTPVAETALDIYTVSASNISGTTTFDVQITVATEEEPEVDEERSTRGGGSTIILTPPQSIDFSGTATSLGENGLAPRLDGNTLKSNADESIVAGMSVSLDDPNFIGRSVVPYTESYPIDIPNDGREHILYVRYFSTTGQRSRDFQIIIPATREIAQPQPTLACIIDFSQINTPIKFGSINNTANVRLLEQFLNTYEGTSLTVDGLYGEADLVAVIAWQEKYAADVLTPWGITNGTGFIFTTSLAKIQSIHAEQCITPVTPEPPASVPNVPAVTTANFSRSLELGMRGQDVRLLQQLLNRLGFTISSTGVGSPGQESDYFGTLTYDAVVRFQAAYADQILAPLGITSPTGYFGPSSIVMIESLLN